ncbi:hypothetical protein MMC25_004701 [Agyrium rufum]|nr:hypothetical protein [Agyrium rufum]
MDAAAYLTNHGWLGDGHALQPSGRGLKKPLLSSRKDNTLGVGKRKHEAISDQWWNRAFDSSLRSFDGNSAKSKPHADDDLGNSTLQYSVRTNRTGATELAVMQSGGAKWLREGLYAGFVKGGGLEGTHGEETSTAATVDGLKTEDDLVKRHERRSELSPSNGKRSSRISNKHDCSQRVMTTTVDSKKQRKDAINEVYNGGEQARSNSKGVLSYPLEERRNIHSKLREAYDEESCRLAEVMLRAA